MRQNKARFDECTTAVNAGCAMFCATAALGCMGTGPGYFVCFGVCWAQCEASGWIGCTAGSAVCYAGCLTCELP